MTDAEDIEPAPRPPDLQGGLVRAWKLQADNPNPCEVAAWLVHDPGGHPAWAWWFLACAHLRPQDGHPEPKLRFPEATHEWMCLALAPNQTGRDDYRIGKDVDPVDPASYGSGNWRHLTPPDWTAQAELHDDDQAAELLRLVVQSLCQNVGGPSLDRDFRSYWVDTVIETATAMRARH